MEIKIIEEKVKKLILEEIKTLVIEACDNPTDDNICKLFNVVEYLKKVLKNDSYTSPISTWRQYFLNNPHGDNTSLTPREPLWGDNNAAASVKK